ncbi:sterol desaturase family protein [Myxococcota bacterium]|nr:sterol desaturase family protein [Myxococcota bacterium]
MADHLDPSHVAIPFYLAAMLWEHRATKRRRAAGEPLLGYEKRDTIASLAVGIISTIPVAGIGLVTFALAEWFFAHRLFDLGTGPLAWVVAMIAWDFAYYWFHRWEHEVRFLWATHVMHHSSERYNYSTALRQPWLPVLGIILYSPIALLGLEPWMIAVAGGFNLIYQFWVHTESVDKMPAWFEAVFNTPSHHRVHHASNERYLDKNHAGVLIVWDKLFGTFEPEVEPVVYGLTKNIRSHNLWTIFVHELVDIARDVRGARSLREVLGYVFGPPGWQPRG